MDVEAPVKKEKKSNKIAMMIVALLLATAGILGWQLLEQQTLVKEERSEKGEIKAELSLLLAEYQEEIGRASCRERV